MLSLKQFRNKYKITQKELAKIIGTTTINQAVIDTIYEKYGEQIRPIGTRSDGRKVWKK